MKGVIFILLEQLVKEKFGPDAWESALRVARPDGGAFVAGETYSDQVLFELMRAVSVGAGVPPGSLVSAFGEFMLGKLAGLYPGFFKDADAKRFLSGIGPVLRAEVAKRHPNASAPRLTCEDPAPDRLVMVYQSSRKLCLLVEGLIDGAARHFGQRIERQQSKCLHRGDDHCRIELTFG